MTSDFSQGLNLVPGKNGAAYIYGTVTAIPASKTSATCGSTGYWSVITVEGKDEAGNVGTHTICLDGHPTYTGMTYSVSPIRSAVSTFTEGNSAVNVFNTSAAISSVGTAGAVWEVRVSIDAYTANDNLALSSAISNVAGSYASGVITFTATSPPFTQTQVETILQRLVFSKTGDAVNQDTRTIRVVMYTTTSTSGFVVNYLETTVNVAAVNDAPVFTWDDLTNSPNLAWSGGETSSAPVYLLAVDANNGFAPYVTPTITDTDDSLLSKVTFTIAKTAGSLTQKTVTTSYGACDASKELLVLNAYAPSMTAQWDPTNCRLTLIPVPASAGTKQAFLDTFFFLFYSKIDEEWKNPGASPNRRIDVVAYDSGSGGVFDIREAAQSNTVSFLIILDTANDADNLAKLDYELLYGEGGLFYNSAASALVSAQVPMYQSNPTQRAFMVRKFSLTKGSTTPFTIDMDFTPDPDEPGVFMNGAIIDPDSTSLGSTWSAGAGVFSIYHESSSSPVSWFNAGLLTGSTSGQFTLRIGIAAASAATVALGEYRVVWAPCGSGTSQDDLRVEFFFDVRQAACPYSASFTTLDSFRTYLPDRTLCGDTNTVTPSAGNAASLTAGAYTAVATELDDFAAQQFAAGATAAQIFEATRERRQRARGGFKVSIPANSYSSLAPVTFGANALSDASKNRLPIKYPSSSWTPNFDMGIVLSPAGQQFVNDEGVEVCIHLGDVPANSAFSLLYASRIDPLDETKGYGPWVPTDSQIYQMVQGRICGTVKHFSIIVPFRVGYSTPPTQQKVFQMGSSCANKCSNNGYCRETGKCACFQGFQGYDCSERMCPVGQSWDNAPSGILHTTAECSNRGRCDRKSGTCACFDGYEGASCQRIACPNGCSGNGKCRFQSELTNVQKGGWMDSDRDWEGDQVQVCVCDGGFIGPDCSQRVCPFGDDPETVCEDTYRQVQEVTIDFGTLPGGSLEEAYGKDDIILVFRDTFGRNHTTRRISNILRPGSGQESLVASLTSLSAFAISELEVSGTGTATTPQVSYRITFDGRKFEYTISVDADGVLHKVPVAAQTVSGNTVPGNQALLQCVTMPNSKYLGGCSGPGCSPLFKQPRILDIPAGAPVRMSDHVVLQQKEPATASLANVPGAWGTTVRVTIYDKDINGMQWYSVSSTLFGSEQGDSLSFTPIPPAELRKEVNLMYGLAVDFDDGPKYLTPGTYVFRWRLATCSSRVARPASFQYELAECSNRGICDRQRGLCRCFHSFYGANCGQQSVII
jgi:hypothetical protein